MEQGLNCNNIADLHNPKVIKALYKDNWDFFYSLNKAELKRMSACYKKSYIHWMTKDKKFPNPLFKKLAKSYLKLSEGCGEISFQV